LQEWYERTLIWSFYFLPSEYQTNLEFLKQHNLDIKQIVSDVFPLEKINEAFTRRFERQDESLKIVVTMD
jgi:threonine dehydrogenase-like Zn-dependent dehydrogenase